MLGLVKNLKQPNNRLNAALTHPPVKLANVDANGFTCADVALVPHHYGWFNRDLLHKEANLSGRLCRPLETPELTEFFAEQKKGGK